MVGFRSAGCMTLEGGNPKIQFFSNNPDLPPNTIDLAPEDFAKFQQLPGSAPGEEFFLSEALTDAQCNDISLEDYPVYINFNDGQYLAFDPRINPLENTVENPLADGGGSAMDLGAKCSSAARTFLNAHSCKLSTQPNSCHFGLTEVQSDVQVMLDQTKVRSLFTNVGRYVYAVDGLTPETSPCVYGSTSRWVRIGSASSCTVPDTPTFTTLSNLIEVSTKFQNDLQEIKMTSNVCDEASTTPTSSTQIHVTTSDSCWQLVHPDHHNVYDMTPWVSAHPGKIIKIFISSFIFVEPVFILFTHSCIFVF